MPSKLAHVWHRAGISGQVLIGGTLVLALFVLLVWLSVRVGYADYARPITGFGGKKLWDWMEVLGVPLAVALLVAFGGIVAQRAGRRASLERELEENRARQTTLQSYLDTMTNLILERNLNKPEVNPSAKQVAHAQTLATLRALDGVRKGLALRFLYEAELIRTPDPIVPLNQADLTEVDLAGAELEKVDLSGANLAGADLSVANLDDAHLVDADLTKAELTSVILRGARLDRADMSEANLNNAKLDGAYLIGVDLTRANLTWAELPGAHMGGVDLSDAVLKNTNMAGADLSGADLSDAVLKNTNMAGADLSDAVLDNADLGGANCTNATLVGADFINTVLTGADFRNAELTDANLSKKQMASTYSLSAATMPDGNTLTEDDWSEFKRRHLPGLWRRMARRLWFGGSVLSIS